MDRSEIINLIASSKIFKQWHWFRWHFQFPLKERSNLLADSIIDACLACESRIPGYAKRTISMLASIGGREKHLPDWEQLIQILAELLVVAHVLKLEWCESTTFESEPSLKKQGKNPEIIVINSDITLAVEVKAPALFDHREKRLVNPEHVVSRFTQQKVISGLLNNQRKTTFPRDNPIKDFLISAQSKFEQFGNDIIRVLVIVWDDHTYEPISSLLHPDSGLLTDNSFYKDSHGNSVEFQSLDAVVVISQLHQILRACEDKPLFDNLVSPLSYDYEYPPKILIANKVNDELMGTLGGLFHAFPLGSKMGAEFSPKDLIWRF